MSEVMDELRKLRRIALPITVINFSTYLRGMISVTCLGRLGRLELAGGALAVGFTNITGYSVLSGLAMGMEPLCSQAFGSGNHPLVYRTLQKTIAMLLLASIPIALLWANLDPVMTSLRQDADVTRVASQYCLYALPDLVANSFLHSTRVYLRSRGKPLPLMWCTSLAVLLHLPLTVILCFTLGMGVPGVAVATWCTNFNTLLFLLLYMVCARESYSNPASPPPLPPPSPPSVMGEKAREEWASLVRLAVPSCLGVCLEWWWYELMTLAAGYLPNPHVTLGAAAIVIQTTSLMYTLPITLSSSVSARIGNELGAARPRRARLAAAVSMALAVLASCLCLLFTTVGRDWWVRVFSTDPDVIRLTRTVLLLIGLCELANCPQTTGCGVLRGSARPSVGAAINLYSFYLVGAPTSLVLAFVFAKGFPGLCYGLLAAQVVCAVSIVAVVCRTDWERESSKAKDLVGTGDGGTCTAAAAAGKDADADADAMVVVMQLEVLASSPHHEITGTGGVTASADHVSRASKGCPPQQGGRAT